MDRLCNLQGYRNCTLILVFDAYRVEGGRREISRYHNIHVVYTKEAETADQYIERFAYQMGKNARVAVATSDGLEQMIIRGAGCLLMSARDLQEDVKRTEQMIKEEQGRLERGGKVSMLQGLPEKVAEQLKNI